MADTAPTPSDELARLRAENEALKAQTKPRTRDDVQAEYHACAMQLGDAVYKAYANLRRMEALNEEAGKLPPAVAPSPAGPG